MESNDGVIPMDYDTYTATVSFMFDTCSQGRRRQLRNGQAACTRAYKNKARAESAMKIDEIIKN